ncbi:hypothetical protein BAL199_17583 [alpha proteobacterium BAL199]|nr:hypothetical protein BAL199_17583 [alpha proteobacterium BAL199]
MTWVSAVIAYTLVTVVRPNSPLGLTISTLMISTRATVSFSSLPTNGM